MTTIIPFLAQFFSLLFRKSHLYVSLFVGWLLANPAKVRLAVFVFTLLLLLVGTAVPSLKMLAEDAPGGGGH